MPTYEYECLKCGDVFEEFQSISDPPRQRCPKCRGKVRRLVGNGVGVVFKGSGFYATDSRRERPGAAGGNASALAAGDGKPQKASGAEKAARTEKAEKTEKTAPKGEPDGAGRN
jgi:putative FmdB family regulatory protein